MRGEKAERGLWSTGTHWLFLGLSNSWLWPSTGDLKEHRHGLVRRLSSQGGSDSVGGRNSLAHRLHHLHHQSPLTWSQTYIIV